MFLKKRKLNNKILFLINEVIKKIEYLFYYLLEREEYFDFLISLVGCFFLVLGDEDSSPLLKVN